MKSVLCIPNIPSPLEILFSNYPHSLFSDFFAKTHRSPSSWRILLYLALLTLLKTSLFLSFHWHSFWVNLSNLISSSHQSPEVDYLSSKNTNKQLFQIQWLFLCHLFPWSFLNNVFSTSFFLQLPSHYAAFSLLSFYFFRQSSVSLTGSSSFPCSLISLYTVFNNYSTVFSFVN